MISGTRGTNSLFPCPICLVPLEELFDLFQDYPIRTALSAEALVKQARTMTQDNGNELLKSQGLRDVDVCHFTLIFYMTLTLFCYRMHFGSSIILILPNHSLLIYFMPMILVYFQTT